MSLKFAGALAGLALSLAPAAASAATTIVLNFDNLSGYGTMPAEYNGVLFGDDFAFYDDPEPGFPPASGLTTIYPNYEKFELTKNHTLSVRFTELVRFDGAFFSGKIPVSYEFYRNGVKVGSADPFGLNPANPARFYASGYNGAVDEIRITGNTGNWVMDDFTFTTGVTAVPEPGTWALMIIGFGGAGAMLRSRRRTLTT